MNRAKLPWLTGLLSLSLATTAFAAQKPDIVFILADDLGSYDVGWRGSDIQTPNLDKLAKAGVKMENFYVQPVCSPTRSSLMTGRYPMRYGFQVGVVRPWADYGLPLEERMLPQALKEVGYTTVICGKWHLGSIEKTYWPNARGFDHWYGHLQGALDYNTHIREGKLDWWRDGEPNKDPGYTTHLVGQEAVRVIKAQPRGKPLFLYVPFNAVHEPLQVPDSYKEPYAKMPEPRRTYAGMTAALDEQVGKIVAAIEESGRRTNTLFIFSSDNGGPQPGRVTSNGPLRAGKGTVYEGGVHTCAFATWDNHLPAGASVNALSHMSDWYPTLINLTGGSLKQKLPIDGKDIWACLAENKPSSRTEVLCNTTPNGGALRVGDWKIVVHEPAATKTDATEASAKKKKKAKQATLAEEKVELFNLAADPSEKNNLAGEKPDKLKELRQRYEELAKQAVPPKNKESGE